MTIEQNIAASNAAHLLIVLALDEAANHKDDAKLHFWKTLLERVLKIVPERMHPKVIVRAPVVPMTPQECDAFDLEILQFGRHHGEPVGAVPLPYLEWLDSQPDFRQQLRRYLAADRTQRHMVVCEDDDTA